MYQIMELLQTLRLTFLSSTIVSLFSLGFDMTTEEALVPLQEPLIIVLLGPPGSGKGTQAVRLSSALGIPHISTGDLFRFNIKNQTALGLEVKKFIDNGKLVPDSLVLDMLFDRLERADCQKGFLLDGVPRTVAQAEELDHFFKKLSEPHLVLFQLLLSDETIVRRITGRRTCQQCGSIYHIEASPPKQLDVCDRCEARLIQRSDDRAEIVEERLKAYHLQTKPVEDFYQQKGVVHAIQASQTADEVFEAMMNTLSALDGA